jgi:hypothetical protein
MSVWFPLLLLVIVAVWYCSRDPRLRNDVSSKLQASNGTFDAPAREAFDANNRIARPTPRDTYTRARILQHWVAENNPEHPAHRAALNTYAEAAEGFAGMTRLDLEDAVMLERIMDLPAGGVDPFTVELTAVTADNARQQHVARAATTANSKLGASGVALATAQRHDEDPQNVHDSVVVSELSKTYAALRIPEHGSNRQTTISNALNSIEAYARKNGASDHAISAITRARSSDMVSGYGDTEDAILAGVWLRADAPENRGLQDNVRRATLTALEECWERGGLVCTGGRAARYLGALAGVDADSDIGSAATLDDYKNEIYSETMKIIEVASSEDTPAAKEYSGVSGATPTAEEKAMFAEKLKAAIQGNVRKYAEKLTPAQLSRVTEDCMVYAML